MIVKLHTHRLQSLEEVRAFLDGSTSLDFDVPQRADAYRWIEQSLHQLRYRSLGRADKGLVRAYLLKISGFSRAQLTRLISQFCAQGHVRDRRARAPRNAFRRRYLPEDIALLAEVDALHGTLSGLATRKLCERALHRFGDTRFERLATISNGGLYNLRHSSGYQRLRVHYTSVVSHANPCCLSQANSHRGIQSFLDYFAAVVAATPGLGDRLMAGGGVDDWTKARQHSPVDQTGECRGRVRRDTASRQNGGSSSNGSSRLGSSTSR